MATIAAVLVDPAGSLAGGTGLWEASIAPGTEVARMTGRKLSLLELADEG